MKPRRDAASFDAASAVSIEATSSATANLKLPLAADVVGTVTDRTSGAFLGGIRATAYATDGSIAARALTGSDGKFAFAARPGSIRIVFDDPSGTYAALYVPDEESFSVEPSMNVSAGSATGINAALVRAAHITGHITDRTTGAPLPAIIAAAYNADGTLRAFATTDTAGAYSIVVPPGDYRVGAFDGALVYLAQFYPGAAHAVTSVGGFDFALAKGARVSGTVMSSGMPLANITVGVYDLTGRLLDSTSTDAAGRYTIFRAPATIKLLAFDPALVRHRVLRRRRLLRRLPHPPAARRRLADRRLRARLRRPRERQRDGRRQHRPAREHAGHRLRRQLQRRRRNHDRRERHVPPSPPTRHLHRRRRGQRPSLRQRLVRTTGDDRGGAGGRADSDSAHDCTARPAAAARGAALTGRESGGDGCPPPPADLFTYR